MTGKRLASTILYAAFLAVFLLASVEVLMRLGHFTPTYLSRANTTITLDRKRLFKILPNSNSGINGRGYRDRDFKVEKQKKPRILFLGDSFIYGIGVRTDSTMPKVLEKMLRYKYEVYNMGVYSYGPDQSLLQLMDEGLNFEPDLVILGIFAVNDFNDVYKNRIFSLNDKGHLVRNKRNAVTSKIPDLNSLYLLEYLRYKYSLRSSGYPFTIDYRVGNIGHIFKDLFEDGYDLDMIRDTDSDVSRLKIRLMRAILKEFKDVLDERGIDFLTVTIPANENIQDYSYLEENKISREKFYACENIISMLCRVESITNINLYEEFISTHHNDKLYEAKSDNHLSKYGNRYAAWLIYKYLIKTDKVSEDEGDI
jgi:hypothetical protein